MTPRFHAPALAATDARVTLPDDEAAHLSRVLRLREGDAVEVFNGRGVARTAVVEVAARGRAVLRVTGAATVAAEWPVPVALAQAVLKGDGMDDVVRDAVMVGAAAIVPVLSARAEWSRAQLARGRRVDRWRRIAVSSAKQCGRAVVPDVEEPQAFEDVLRSGAETVMLVEPSSAGAPVETLDALGSPPARATVLVGPEGGWTRDEVEAAAAAGARLVTLGPMTLRAERAAVVAIPLLLRAWKLF